MSTKAELWAEEITRDCFLSANGDNDAALLAAQIIVATQPIPMSIDTSGHEHKGKGEGGGQFVGKGKQTESHEFKKWFAGSKIVDRSGNPKRVYHGTGKNFNKFDWDKGAESPGHVFGAGFYFSPNAEVADMYAGAGEAAQVMPVYLSIKNPLILDPKNVTEDVREFAKQGSAIEKTKWAIAHGYDGVISVPIDEIVAFYPEQIKSAIGNAGTFDPDKAEINLSIDAFFAHDIFNRQAQSILNRSLVFAKGMSAAARKDLDIALKRASTGSGEAILNFIDKYRVQLAKILTQTQIASILSGARTVADKIPTLVDFPGAIPPPPTLEPHEAVKLIEHLEELALDMRAEEVYKLRAAEQVYVNQAIAARAAPPVVPPTIPVGNGDPDDVHLVTIDEAVKNLAERNVMDRQKYDALEAAARAKAFTVANVAAEETLTKIRDSLAENVREGADYEAWRKKVVEDVGQGTFMSDAHQETVFRTNVQAGFSDGQESILSHPLVRSGFPYRARDAIHDDRVRHNHLALEKLGIQGTNIYRADDPVWQMFRAPWDYNDRCSDTAMTVRQAAEKGIKEAKTWLETGVEPTGKAWVKMPDFRPPPGFQRAVVSAPMSIQLSMRSIATFATDATGHQHRGTGQGGGQFTKGGGGGDSDSTPNGKQSKLKSGIARVKSVASRVGGRVSELVNRVPVVGRLKRGMAAAIGAINKRNEAKYGPVKAKAIMWGGAVVGGYGIAFGAGALVGIPGVPVLNDLLGILAATAVADVGSLVKRSVGLSTDVFDLKRESRRFHAVFSKYVEALVAKHEDDLIGVFREDGGAAKIAAKIVGAAKSNAALSITLAVESERAQLTAGILVALFGDSAEQVAEDLVGNLDAAFAPVLTRRYGPRPGPNWVSGGISTKGKQIWLWTPSGSPSTPAAPTPPIITPAPAPVAIPPAATPVQPPAPNPKVFQFTQAAVPVNPTSSGGKAQARSIEAYNDAMTKLASGQPLDMADKAKLARQLTNMPVGLLRDLYGRLGGKNYLPNTKAAVASVKAIIAGNLPPVAPAAVSPSPLSRGSNMITGAPAGPAYYQPPAPDLSRNIAPYAGVSSSGGSGALPTTIDHTTVGQFPNSPFSVSKDYTLSSDANKNVFVEFTHAPSGYRVMASWTHGGVVSPGGSGSYKINVLDGAGKVVSTYDSQAPRDHSYVEGRAVQVAMWLEGELANIAKSKATNKITAPLAQFAWDYAQAAGIKPGVAPFDPSEATAHLAKIDAHLRSQFSKLIGARQHAPHGGMDTIEHTMNIVNPANLRTAGLSDADAKILRLGMIYHDVGKQHDPLDHEHPRKSAEDAEEHLWQFGLTPREVSDTLAVIKWHDTYGNQSRKPGGEAAVAKQAFEYTDDSLPHAQRVAAAKRINDLLMRAFQSDVSTIPGLTSKPVPGRPDIKVHGFLDVDKLGPAFRQKVDDEIDKMSAPPKALPLPKKPPTVHHGATRPDLVAHGKKWGELVQRTDNIPVGEPVPHGSTKTPPQEVYDEAHKNPDLNYARAFNMGYDGPTGRVIKVYHGTNPTAGGGILSTGIRAGTNGDNVFGHGVYTVVNGAKSVPSGYVSGAVAQMELHTGRTVDYHDLKNNILPKWKKANPKIAKKLAPMGHSSINAEYTAAALWAGYSTIALDYNGIGNTPTMVVLDPARVVVRNIVDASHNGMTIKTLRGNVTSHKLSHDEVKTPAGHIDHTPVKGGVPDGWRGTPKTS